MKLLITLSILLLIGCSDNSDRNRQSYLPISEFNLDSNVIQENDEIKIIYCSSGGNANPNKEFLIQFIAIRIKTKDTLNILGYHSDFLHPEDGDKIFQFRKLPSDDVTQLLKLDQKKFEVSKNIDSLDLGLLIPKVILDQNFADLAINDHPTVLGEIVSRD